MQKLIVFIVFACGASCLSAQLSGTASLSGNSQMARTLPPEVYYVDAITPGSDSSTGTQLAPWATVTHAAAVDLFAILYLKMPDGTWTVSPPYVGLKAYWIGMQGASATTLYDIANGNHGTIHSGTWSFGGITLNGTSDYISVPPLIGNANAWTAIGTVRKATEIGLLLWAETNSGDGSPGNTIVGMSSLRVSYARNSSLSGGSVSQSFVSGIENKTAYAQRNGNNLTAGVIDAGGGWASSTTLGSTASLTTNLGAIGARDKGASQDSFWGGTIFFLQLYDSVQNVSEVQSVNRAALWARNIELPQVLPALVSGPIWIRQGIVVPGEVAEENTVQEPTVIYIGGCLLVSPDVNDKCFKMWYTGQLPASIFYAESTDGITNWVKHGTAVLAGYNESHVMWDGTQYRLYGPSISGGHEEYTLHTSPDGVTWTPSPSNPVLTIGDPAGWDGTNIWNVFVFQDEGTWRMMYEATGPTFTGGYQCGVAASPDGVVWTKSTANPVTRNIQYGCSGPWVSKVNGRYYAWTQNVFAISDIRRFTADQWDGYWQLYPTDSQGRTYTFARGSVDEGFEDIKGQVADVCVIEVAGKTYLYYAAYPSQDFGAITTNIKLLTFNGTIAQIVQTMEGATTNTP